MRKPLEHEDGSHDDIHNTEKPAARRTSGRLSEQEKAQEIMLKQQANAAKGGRSKTTWKITKDKETGKKKIVWNVDHIKEHYGSTLNPYGDGRGAALTTVGEVVDSKEGEPGSPSKKDVVPGTPVSQARKSISPTRAANLQHSDTANLRMSTIAEGDTAGAVKVSDINLLSADNDGGTGRGVSVNLAGTKMMSDLSMTVEATALAK